MGILLYNIFLLLFKAGAGLASLVYPKAKKWTSGRKNIFGLLESAIGASDKVIWMHCASLGEFEQGRPVLERLREIYPSHKILLTFFSPSGYEIRKDYDGADWVCYLPLDGRRNAKRFLDIVHPSLVVFVKYEFWYYYLKEAKTRQVPLLLISAIFRQNSPFFRWYGGLHRSMLKCYSHLFVQDDTSKQLLDGIGLADKCSLAGDTRFDRVNEIAGKFKPIPEIENFIGADKAIIAGSTWPEDELVLQKAFRSLGHPGLKMIIAPHEIDERHMAELLKLFPDATRFSQLVTSHHQSQGSTVLIIDNIGMLSRLYSYAWVTYVGGALNKRGIHNVLEAAVYNKIVLFGPVYGKYAEVVALVRAGGGIPFNDIRKDGSLLRELLEGLLADEKEYQYRSRAAGEFVRANLGATEKVLRFIQENRLLTN